MGNGAMMSPSVQRSPEISHSLTSSTMTNVVKHQGVGYSSKMEKVKRAIVGSPRDRKSNKASDLGGSNSSTNTICQYFGVPLMELLNREKSEVPNLVTKACTYIYDHGVDEKGIFRVNGNVRVVESLKASFNKTGDADFKEVDVMSVASLLKMFLRELPSNLIPEDLTRTFIIAQTGNAAQPHVQLEQFFSLLQQIPLHFYKTLKYLMIFLVLIAKHSPQNQMEPKSLGIVFAPCIFSLSGLEDRCSGGNIGLTQQGITNQILTRFIINFDVLFLSKGEESPNLPGFVFKKLQVRDREVSSQTKVEVNTSLPVPPPRKKKSPGTKKQTPPPPPRIRHSVNPNMPVPAARKSNVVPEVIQPPVVTDNQVQSNSHSDDELVDTNRSNSPFALESDRSEFSTAPSPRSSRAHDEIIEIVINMSVDEFLFGITNPIPDVPQPKPKQKQQTEVLENGFSTLSIKERMKQMEENHKTKQQEDGHVSKPMGQLGFDLFKEKNATGGITETTVKTKTSVAKQDVDGQGNISPQSPPKESAGDLFDLPQNSGRTLYHPQTNRVKAPSRRLPTRHHYRKSAHQIDTSMSWSTDQDQPPQTRPFLPEPQLDVNQNAKPSMNFLSERELISPEKTPLLNSKPYVPPLDFSTLHEHGDGSEPISLEQGYSISLQKANQCEDGETALLSPRTSKMRAKKIAHPNTDIPPSPPTDQTHIPSKPIIDDKSNLTVKQLTKKIQSYKKHIKEFEEQFEASHGYRPSQTDKAAVPEVKRNMQELQKTRKELRKLKEEIENERRGTMPVPVIRPTRDEDLFSKERPLTMKETLQSILKTLEQKRAEINRPTELSEMTMEEIVDEKLAVQKALLHFESIHGRPVTKEDKALMRPLYDRYRNIKKTLSNPQSPWEKSMELQSVPEGQPLDFTPSSADREVVHVPTAEHVEEQEDFMVTREFNLMGHDTLPGVGAGIPDMLIGCDGPSQSLHHLTRQELLDEQQKARAERKHLRNLLREYESELYKQIGGKIQRKAQAPIQAEYKHVKERLKLLKALLSKHDSLSAN